jgi:hypothetical protein
MYYLLLSGHPQPLRQTQDTCSSADCQSDGRQPPIALIDGIPLFTYNHDKRVGEGKGREQAMGSREETM